VKRVEENLQVLAAEYQGIGVQTHLPAWMKHTQAHKDANLLWVHWLKSVLLETDPHPNTSGREFLYLDGNDYGSNSGYDEGTLRKRPHWLLPQEAKRLSNGEVHEEELIELWKVRATESTKGSSILYDDSLRRELVKVLTKARHRVRVLFQWHKDSMTTLNELDDEASDTYRCVDFRQHEYPWEKEDDWPIYKPMVGQHEDPMYWSLPYMDDDQGSYESGMF
jgi:hypothetical protein